MHLYRHSNFPAFRHCVCKCGGFTIKLLLYLLFGCGIGIKWKTKQKCNLIFLVKYSTSNVYFVCSNKFFVYCWLVCCPNPPNPNVSFQIVWLNLITVARLFLKDSRVLNSQLNEYCSKWTASKFNLGFWDLSFSLIFLTFFLNFSQFFMWRITKNCKETKKKQQHTNKIKKKKFWNQFT